MYPLYLFQIKPVLRMSPKKKIRKKSGQMPKQESLQNCKMPWLTMAEQRKRQKCKERKRMSREKSKEEKARRELEELDELLEKSEVKTKKKKENGNKGGTKK